MSWKTKTLPVVFGLIVLSGSTASRGEESRDPSHFTYARLYCAPDGNTHFQDVTVDLRKTNFAPPASPINIGNDFAASRAFFGGFDAGWGARDLAKAEIAHLLRYSTEWHQATYAVWGTAIPLPLSQPIQIAAAARHWRFQKCP